MIQAKDLRLNNYLLYNGEVKQVSSIHNDETIRFKDGNSSIGCFSIKNENIQPIPLTEEILLKCGFYHDTYDDWFILSHEKGVSISHIIDGVTHYFGKEEYVWADVLNEIKYLHQLQNLYFALTGEELTVNL